jgi:phosphatidylinositol alpha-1,6-mannosyltransferase
VRILIPTADYPPIEGGISTVTLQLARELTKLGHDVTVIAPHFAGVDAFDRSEPYRVVRYGGYGFGWLRFVPLALASTRYLRNSDVILGINTAYGGVIGLVANAARGIPYVTFAYAYEFLKFPAWSPPAALLRAAYRRSRVVIAISSFTRDALERFCVPAERIETIFPGAPVPRDATAQQIAALKQRLSLNGHRVILAAGRMVRRKGHATLVRAMPRILERHPDSVLICVGRGPAQQAVERAAAEFGVTDHVRLTGRVSDEDLATLYAMCDVFALPVAEGARGQVEGFGLVFAEAAAYGKAVVAGNSGGVTDAVLDGETGLLVPPGDPEASAVAILRILDDANLARRLGDAGRERVERELNWAVFTRRLMEAVERRA